MCYTEYQLKIKNFNIITTFSDYNTSYHTIDYILQLRKKLYIANILIYHIKHDIDTVYSK